MSPDLTVFALSGATSLGVSAVAGAATVWLARRNISWASFAAPLAAVGAVAAGVMVAASAMVFEGRHLDLLWWILAASVPVAVISGALLSREVRRQELIRAQAESEAERESALESSRQELIAWVSHDLRTPLAGIRATAEGLRDGVFDDPPKYLNKLVTQSTVMASLVQDLLNYTSLTSGAVALRHDDVDVADAVSDAIATAAHIAERNGVEITGDVDGVTVVRGDARLIARAVQNVVTNAAQHSRSGGTVAMRIVGDAHSVRVRVKDNGGGLSDEALQRAFEPGWRGSSARTPGQDSGTGLGLAVVDAVMKAHQGTVTVCNVEGGCCVDLLFPRGAQSTSG